MNQIQSFYVSAALLIGAASIGAAQLPACRASDASTTRVLEWVKTLSTLNIPARDSIGLAGVDSSAVVSETDSTACVRVSQSLDSLFRQSDTPSASLVIVRAGSRFFAWTPSTDPSEPNSVLHVVDTVYVYRRSIAAF
jgi:hypothetical protein